MSEDESSKVELTAVLELPPEEAPEVTSSVEALFADESMAFAAAKLAAVEGMLRLLPKDVAYVDFMRELLMICMRAVKSEAGSIFEVGEHSVEGRYLFFRVAVGQSSDKVSQFTIPFGKGIVGHVAESKQVMVVDRAHESEIHLKTLSQAVGFETRNMIALPILIRGKVFGVLELLNRVGDAHYARADIDFLTQLVELMAKAIEVRLMLAHVAQGLPANVRTAA